MSLTLCWPIPTNPWFVKRVVPYSMSPSDATRVGFPIDRATASDADTAVKWGKSDERFLCGPALYVYADRHPFAQGANQGSERALAEAQPEWFCDQEDRQIIQALTPEYGFYRLTPSWMLRDRPYEDRWSRDWRLENPYAFERVSEPSTDVEALQRKVTVLLEVVQALAYRGSEMGNADRLAEAINRLDQEISSVR